MSLSNGDEPNLAANNDEREQTALSKTKNSPLRIVFMGTPEFAVPSLDILVKNGYDVVGVVTTADKWGGRGGKQLIESPVKLYAIRNNIPVLQPEKLKAPAFIDALRSWKADLQIVVAFRMLPEIVWAMPPLGTMNVHGSLLPKYRGAAPINWAIIEGEWETGVTTFFLRHEIDTGDVLFTQKIPIGENDTAGDLHDRMMIAGAEILLKSVRAAESGDYLLQRQPDTLATHAPKIFMETCEINFAQPVEKVYNFIRGLSPYPTAWTLINGLTFKIFSAQKETAQPAEAPSVITTDHKTFVKIACLDGYIHLLDVQLAGKKRMGIKDFLNGAKIIG